MRWIRYLALFACLFAGVNSELLIAAGVSSITTFTLTLTRGENWISFPMNPTPDALGTVFTEGDAMRVMGGSAISSLVNGKFRAVVSGGKDDYPVEGGKTYVVFVPSARTIALRGIPWKPSLVSHSLDDGLTDLALSRGTPNGYRLSDLAGASGAGAIYYNRAGRKSAFVLGLSPDRNIAAGEGYFASVARAVTITYPDTFPDAKLIYASDRAGFVSQVFIAGAKGESPRQLTFGCYGGSPNWFGDGVVSFGSQRSSESSMECLTGTGLYTVEVGTGRMGTILPLIRGTAILRVVALEDGTGAILDTDSIERAGAEERVYHLDYDSKALVPLASNFGDLVQGACSTVLTSTRQNIIYYTVLTSESRWLIYRQVLGSTTRTPMSDPSVEAALDPFLSRSGKWLYYTRFQTNEFGGTRGGTGDIYRMRADMTGPHELVFSRDGSDEFVSAISPDDETLYIVSNTDPSRAYNIYTFELATKVFTKISDGPGTDTLARIGKRADGTLDPKSVLSPSRLIGLR